MLPPPAAGSEGLRPLEEDLGRQLKFPTVTNDSLRSVTEGEVLIWHLGKKISLEMQSFGCTNCRNGAGSSRLARAERVWWFRGWGSALDTPAGKPGQWHVGIDLPVPLPGGQGWH